MAKCPNCGYEIKRDKKHRSNAENSYFHGVVLPILSEHTGYDVYEMKGIVKYRFGVKKTSSLTTAEFEKFMSDVRQWASYELSCFVPTPNEAI